jgi:hypothetical protein
LEKRERERERQGIEEGIRWEEKGKGQGVFG